MMKNILLSFLFTVLLFGGCSSYDNDILLESEADYDLSEPAVRSVMAPQNSMEMPEQPAKELKKIIKTGRMGFQVADLPPARQRTDSLVAVYGGYYANENYSESQSRPGVRLLIRLPSERYESFIAALEAGQEKMLYKEISARDVTEEYVDVEVRLGNKRSYLERYRELVKRASTIKEILEIEEHIRRLEEEIESAEGRLRYLTNQAAYSTLDLQLSTEYISVPDPGSRFGRRFKSAVSSGWDRIVGFFLGLVYLWPFLLIAAGAGYWWLQRRRKKQNPKT